ncbi:MAG: DUF4153 domain-containing protein, partial [Clostridia bacterium]|nr:DUF4153 domain-containing protein [Clostridia bacterium]
AFFTALLYGIVILAGGSGIAGAVQALLYKGMSGKVYMHISTIAGFLAYGIFIGYFPDFSKSGGNIKLKEAQSQPGFIKTLFEYIMAPLLLALTVVLLIWSGKVIITGMDVSFIRLSSIATGYALLGLWLHIMLTHNKSGIAKFYRRAYPLAALVILLFEARTLLLQIDRWGIKTPEYTFALIWIMSISAVVLLISMKDRSQVIIAAIICALAVFSVLPLLGYHDLTAANQINRLEKMLTTQGILQNGKIKPAAQEPEKDMKEKITDAVNYLANMENPRLPSWFDNHLNDSSVFRNKLGFEQTWPDLRPESAPGRHMGIHLSLPTDVVDISGYRWAANIQDWGDRPTVIIEGEKGAYEIHWNTSSSGGIPTIKIELDGRTIIDQDMNSYFDKITAKYPPGKAQPAQVPIEDMTLSMENDEIRVLLLFNNVSINVDTAGGNMDYWLSLQMLYMSEKE